MKRLLAALLGICAGSSAFAVDTWGPAMGHTISNIRAYPDGSFVFQFTPALTAGRQFDDHAVVPYSTANSFKMISALGISAFNTHANVRISTTDAAPTGA